MVTDNNGRAHEPAGTPRGGRFARKNGSGSDSDLDDFTQTRTYADLDRYWNDEDYMLEAQEANGSWESIDRDQAVDEQGTPYYERYAFSAPDDTYRHPDRTFSAEQMGRYADIADSVQGENANIGTDTMEAIDKAAEGLDAYIQEEFRPYEGVYRIDDVGHYVSEDNWTKVWSQYPSWWEKAWLLADNGDYYRHDVADMSIEEITEAFERDDLALDFVFFTQADEHGHC